MKFFPLIGRILFAMIFLISAPGHFTSETIGFVASKGLPMPNVLVPFSGILEGLGALSVLLGYKTKWGAFLIIAFLLPVSFTMHAFWTVTDPMMQRMDMANFMKNIAIIGGALLIAYFGAGPYSLDARAKTVKPAAGTTAFS